MKGTCLPTSKFFAKRGHRFSSCTCSFSTVLLHVAFCSPYALPSPFAAVDQMTRDVVMDVLPREALMYPLSKA